MIIIPPRQESAYQMRSVDRMPAEWRQLVYDFGEVPAISTWHSQGKSIADCRAKLEAFYGKPLVARRKQRARPILRAAS